VLIEYEGISSRKSRHTTVTGFTNDCEKYNQAQLTGWKVLRYTVLNKSQFFTDIESLLWNHLHQYRNPNQNQKGKRPQSQLNSGQLNGQKTTGFI